MKEFSMKISDYIEFKKPNYTFLKLIPSNSIRNYNSDKILGLIAGLYRNIDKRIRTENKKLFFECNAKVSYYVYMEHKKVEFYFIVPETHYRLFKDKIIDTWSNKITITQVSELPLFDKNCTKYYLDYKKEDAMSLNCDKRNNILLNSMLYTIKMMEDGDKVGVFYNFSPVYQKGWRINYDKTITKLKNDMPINKNKLDVLYISRRLLLFISTCIDVALEIVSLGKKTVAKPMKDLYITDDTKRKRDSVIINTQILCLSESNNKNREHNNAVSVCQSFQCLDGDNSVTYSKHKGNFEMFGSTIRGVSNMKLQVAEGQSLLSLPGRELLEEHKVIEHTDVLETEVPLKLQNGYISLGVSTYKGNEVEAFHRDNYDQGSFPLVLLGEQGSGKTTYISNYVNYIQKRNEGCIVIDFIKNCELSDSIKEVVPTDKLIELDMSDIHCVQGIGYNELYPISSKPMDLLDVANQKMMYICQLIDAVNVEGDPLSSSMDRFLSSAANIVFLNNSASLKDVTKCLNNYEYRKRCLNNIPESLVEDLSDEISSLKELDELDKDGNIIGTRLTKIDGINHRINLLRKDLRLKMMFNRGCENNIDLVKSMDEGKIILVKLPQRYFATAYSKNVIVTYLFTKIWAAMLVRGEKEKQPKKFHVIIDEIFQTKTAMQMLNGDQILPQTRKFGCRFIVSAQYLGQISLIDQTLRSAGASYMLMKGSGKIAFNEFKDELSPYTLEDLEALPQYSSLNLINYEEGRVKFVTQLPKPL